MVICLIVVCFAPVLWIASVMCLTAHLAMTGERVCFAPVLWIGGSATGMTCVVDATVLAMTRERVCALHLFCGLLRLCALRRTSQ